MIIITYISTRAFNQLNLLIEVRIMRTNIALDVIIIYFLEITTNIRRHGINSQRMLAALCLCNNIICVSKRNAKGR